MGKAARRAVKEFDFAAQRRSMVEHHIAGRGVRSKSVLRAMGAVRREEFLPPDLYEFAYEDSPLPIAGGQTISQPYIVAFMMESLLLEGGEKVLEIGTGSGYAAAILAEIAKDVYSVERIGQLAEKPPPRWPSKATTMCTSCTAMGPAVGPSTCLKTRSWSRWAAQRFQKRCKYSQGRRASGNTDRHHPPRARTGACNESFADRISTRRARRCAFRADPRQGGVGG